MDQNSIMRAKEMLGVAAEYIETHWPEGTVEYDETTCDGYCVVDDCRNAAGELVPEGKACPKCGSTDVSWQCHKKVNGAASDGRLKANEVDTLFVLGCNYCSETIDTKTSEEVAGVLARYGR